MNCRTSLIVLATVFLTAGAAHAQYSPAPPAAQQQDSPQTCEMLLSDVIREYLEIDSVDLAKTLEDMDADDDDVEAVGDAIEEEFDVNLNDADWNVIEDRSGNEIAAMLRSKRTCD